MRALSEQRCSGRGAAGCFASRQTPGPDSLAPLPIFHGNRPDHSTILGLIAPGASVLDLGCGNGELLSRLAGAGGGPRHGRRARSRRHHLLPGHGLNVVHADIGTSLAAFGDGQFEVVVLSQALQCVADTERVLNEIVRIGHQAIVSFPNFAYRRLREIFWHDGRAPKVEGSFGYDWYDTPNRASPPFWMSRNSVSVWAFRWFARYASTAKSGVSWKTTRIATPRKRFSFWYAREMPGDRWDVADGSRLRAVGSGPAAFRSILRVFHVPFSVSIPTASRQDRQSLLPAGNCLPFFCCGYFDLPIRSQANQARSWTVMAVTLDQVVPPNAGIGNARESSRKLSPFAARSLRATIPKPGTGGKEEIDIELPARRWRPGDNPDGDGGRKRRHVDPRSRRIDDAGSGEPSERLAAIPHQADRGKETAVPKGQHTSAHRVTDLLEFKRRSDAARRAALQDLADDAQENGMGY